MNGVTQRELSFLLLLWGLSDPRIADLRKMPRCFSIKLHSETQVYGRLGMSWGRHAQNPLSGEQRKTLSITHHALSPPPSHHHLYIIFIPSIDYNVFIVLQCHLKDLLCRKVTWSNVLLLLLSRRTTIAISVPPSTHLHLSEVKKFSVKCVAQGHNIALKQQCPSVERRDTRYFTDNPATCDPWTHAAGSR